MHDEQIRLRGDGEFHRGEAGVHGGGEARDGAGIFHLQAVDRAVVVADFARAEQDLSQWRTMAARATFGMPR
jgi:hypothetical protein